MGGSAPKAPTYSMNQSSDSDDMIIHNGSDDEDKGEGLSESPMSKLYWNEFLPKVIAVITADDSNEEEMRHSHG
jgi:hypothetical protein